MDNQHTIPKTALMTTIADVEVDEKAVPISISGEGEVVRSGYSDGLRRMMGLCTCG